MGEAVSAKEAIKLLADEITLIKAENKKLKQEKRQSTNEVVEQTYVLLETAFGVPKLSKEELIEKAKLVKKLLCEEVDEFIDAINGVDNDGEIDETEMLNACADVLVVASNLPYYAGITLEDLKEECDLTYESNLTKFCKTEEEAERTVEAYANGIHPNKPGTILITTYKETGNKRYPYVIMGADGKILKSINFKDVWKIRLTK